MTTQNEESRALWELYLGDYRKSGKNAKQWCSEKGLSYSTFRYWRRKIEMEREAEIGPEWILLETDGGVAKGTLQEESAAPQAAAPSSSYPLLAAAGSAPITIHAGAFAVDIPRDADIFHLLRVLSAVKSLC